MTKAKTDSLETYRQKRDFSRTPEPSGAVSEKSADKKKAKSRLLSFVVQKHEATRLHYDFRLEMNGVLKSWAVTKGPSLNPADKRLAVRTEDHPLAYGNFEGVIPQGYGAGTVMLWDQGIWIPKSNPAESLKSGSLKFELKGERLKGGWALVLMKNAKSPKGRENWLLIKERDDVADEDFDPLASWTDSITTGRNFQQIENGDVQGKSKGRRQSGKVKFPEFVRPQLAALKDSPPPGPDWLHELKFDGYRIQALLSGNQAKLITRNGKNWTKRYPAIAAALSKLNARSAILDGELVALDPDGKTNFSKLQAATEAGKDDELAYFAFDLISLDGKSLQGKPLSERKEKLRKLILESGHLIKFSDHVSGTGDGIIAQACALGLEGIVSKKISSPYRSGRGLAWIKSKCVGRDEFVIGGYRKSAKKGRPFASLLVGEFDNGKFLYRGRVGTGFSDASLQQLSEAMSADECKTPSFKSLPAEARQDAIWVTPRLIAEVSYADRTAGGLLRHAAFLGLREDKETDDVTSSDQKELETFSDTSEDGAVLGVRLTSPGRVVFEEGVTKADIAHYYAEFAARILTFAKNHPISLVRCPSGVGQDCFFQKHVKGSSPSEFGHAPITQSDGTPADYIMLNTPEALIAATQIGVIELHPWGSALDRLEYPDRLVIDLDPGEERSFGDVRSAAFEVREVMAAAGLESFALLTGGKGIHVIAPLERRRTWTDVKSAARGLARQMAAAKPDLYVSEMSKKKRVGKIFIDWLRNERGATAICPYSLRARAGASLAAPVSWDELPRIRSANAYAIGNIRQRIARLKSDPWEGYQHVRQSLSNSVLDFLAD